MAKGYQRPKSDTVGEKMARVTTVTGVIGTIGHPGDPTAAPPIPPSPSLWERIETELRARNWNWITLADKVYLSHQRLRTICQNGLCPEQTFRALCRVFEWNPTDVMMLEWSDADDDRGSKPTDR